MFIAIMSLPASSGDSVALPWYRSGARARKPAPANRSVTFLICGANPHHSWMTTTPGPFPAAGIDRYPAVVAPLLENLTISPGIDLPSCLIQTAFSCKAFNAFYEEVNRTNTQNHLYHCGAKHIQPLQFGVVGSSGMEFS